MLFVSALLATKILIPVYFNAAGGAAWNTFLVINNRMSKPFSTPGLSFLVICPIPEGCFSDSVPPGQFGAPFPTSAAGAVTTSPAGLLLQAPEDEADRLTFRLMISAQPRNPLERATEIRVVRERDLRTDLISLPYVELQGPVRVRLRVYDPDRHANAHVRVSLRPWYLPGAAPDASTVLTLQAPAAEYTPAYAEIDVQRAFPDAIAHGTYFNIDIEPLTPGLRFWAFATITDNATNDVQTVTPH